MMQVQKLKRLSRLMDSEFKGPFGTRFGLDGLLGFIPGLGDIATTTVSFYIILQAAQLGCTPAVVMRMGLNVIFDNVIDMVPLFGNFADFFWRANDKNISLLEKHLSHPRKSNLLSIAVLMIPLFAVVGLITASCYLAFITVRFASGIFTAL